MNHRSDREAARQGALDREWQLQERALQEERQGSVGNDDPLLTRYRLVARALRQPLPDGLPADFARRLATELAQSPLDLRLERGLMRGLTVLLALSGAVAAAVYGASWLPSTVTALSALPAITQDWTLVLAICVALSWSLEQLRQSARMGRNANA